MGKMVALFLFETTRYLHEVIFPVFIAILVTGPGHVILGKHLVIGVILLPLLLLPLLRHPSFFLFLLHISSKLRLSVFLRRFVELTLCWCKAWSRFLSSLSLSSFSCLRSGVLSSLVLFKRLTIGFSRWGIRIFLTYISRAVRYCRDGRALPSNKGGVCIGTFLGSWKPT